MADLAAELQAKVPVLASRLVEAISISDEAYRRGGHVAADELWQACHDNILECLQALAAGMQGDMPMLSTRATGRRRAEQGLPLESLLHAYRLGWRVIWEAMLEHARVTGRPALDALAEGAGMVWDMMDEYSAAVATAYRSAELEINSRRTAQRDALLHALISGLAAEGDLRIAPRVLDLPDSGPYLVAVGSLEPERPLAGEQLIAALEAQGMRSAWLTRDGGLIGVLAPPPAQLPAVARNLRAAGVRRMGLSPAAETLELLPGAHRQAELALRAIPVESRGVVALDECLTSALLAASPELAGRLLRRTLAPIIDLGREESDALLSTLRAYVDASGSVTEVARRLKCHRNTVFNRISRIRDLTGLDPTNPGQMSDLLLALRALDLSYGAIPAD